MPRHVDGDAADAAQRRGGEGSSGRRSSNGARTSWARAGALAPALVAWVSARWQRLQAWQSRRGWQASHTLYRFILSSLGLLGVILAIPATLASLYNGIGAYDEGVLLTGAHLLLRGEVPYRDFYSNYPPGIFLLLAVLFKLFGVSVGVERALGFVLHLAIPALAGRVAGRQLGLRFSFIVAGLVASWLVILGVNAFAWLAAFAIALSACELWAWAHARGRPLGYLLPGAALGVLSWFRHDLFIYFTLSLGGFAAVWVGLGLRRGDRTPLVPALWTLAGALLVACLMWVPVFALAGFRQVTADLYFDQVRHTMPARVLPLPSLSALGEAVWAPLPLPAFLRTPFAAAVLLTLLGPVLAGVAVLKPRWLGSNDRAGLIWPLALTIAVVPQMLGRTDVYHAVFAVTPALMASAVWLIGGPLRRWRASTAWALAVVGVVVLYLPIRDRLEVGRRATAVDTDPELPRAGRTRVAKTRKRIVSFIRQHTNPEDPIFVGLTDHRWTYSNDMDLYFLADRLGATRYMQFDPNLANREDVQRTMIAELDRTQAKVAILVPTKKRNEPNESRKKGSSLLDRYLRRRYAEQGKVGGVLLLLRKPAAGEGTAPH